jgi:hypothetical protein
VSRALRLLSCTLLFGCASTSGQGAGVASPASAAAASELSGVWSEYWAVAGQADTQRYTFQPGGEFSWAAAPSVSAPASGTALQKRGRFELREGSAGRTLVLHVAETELAGCDSACEGDDHVFAVKHDPALQEVMALSDCPPNVEAQSIDKQYACVALDDRAFWRKVPATATVTKAP